MNFLCMTFLFEWLLGGSSTASTDDKYKLTSAGKFPSARSFTGSIYDGDNSIYILGGMLKDRSISRDILRYDISTNKVDVVGEFPIGVVGSAGVTDGNGNFTVFVASGGSLGPPTPEGPINVYKFSNSNFIPALEHSLHNAFGPISAVTTSDNTIYFTSGGKSLYHYNATDGVETEVYTCLKPGQQGPGCGLDSVVLVNNNLVMGGYATNQLVEFNPTTTICREFETKRTDSSTMLAVGEDIYFVGGRNGPPTPCKGFCFQKYSTSTGNLEILDIPGDSRAYPFLHASAVFVPKLNRIYVFGGDPYQLDTIFYIQLE